MWQPVRRHCQEQMVRQRQSWLGTDVQSLWNEGNGSEPDSNKTSAPLFETSVDKRLTSSTCAETSCLAEAAHGAFEGKRNKFAG